MEGGGWQFCLRKQAHRGHHILLFQLRISPSNSRLQSRVQLPSNKQAKSTKSCVLAICCLFFFFKKSICFVGVWKGSGLPHISLSLCLSLSCCLLGSRIKWEQSLFMLGNAFIPPRWWCEILRTGTSRNQSPPNITPLILPWLDGEVNCIYHSSIGPS